MKNVHSRTQLVTITALSATLAAAAVGSDVAWMVAASTVLMIALLVFVAPGGLTASQRIRRRLRRPVRHRNLRYSTSDIGTVWDGNAVSMYVAFLPSPFQISVTDVPDPILAPPHVPLDLIRNHLVQGDIRLAEINVLSHSYRRFKRGPYNDAYQRMVGETPLPTQITTVIEVKVDLSRSHESVKARATDGSTPAALGRTAHIVAARLERKLNIEGYESRLLRRAEIDRFHISVLANLNSGLQNEKWTYLGGDQPSVITRPAEWTARAAGKWYSVQAADRMASAIRIQPGRFEAATVSGAIGYTYSQAPSLPEKSQMLRRAAGEQGDTASLLLPLAKTVEPSHTYGSLTLAEGDRFPIAIPGAGLGILLGSAVGGGRCFLNLQTGGESLYVHGPMEFVACLLARASAVGATVGIHVDGPIWEQLAAVNPDLIEFKPAKARAIELYRDRAPRSPERQTAVVAWCPRGVPDNAIYSIRVGVDGAATISTPDGDVDFDWSVSADEARYLPQPVAAY